MRTGACRFRYLGLPGALSIALAPALGGCAVDLAGVGEPIVTHDAGGTGDRGPDSPPSIDGPPAGDPPPDAGTQPDAASSDLPLEAAAEAKPDALPAGHSMRFFGSGLGDIDRVKIPVDNPTNSLPGPPVDVGATDFTFELWMMASAADNRAGPVACGNNFNVWHGNMIADRDRMNEGRVYGLSVADGRVVFGVGMLGGMNRSVCGRTIVLDGRWHHVAAERRRFDGYMAVYVDGKLDAEGMGPTGDLSYPDDAVPRNDCNGPCRNDIHLVLGANKFDRDRTLYPPYNGWLDELRVSNTLRYMASFTPPKGPFSPDINTVALYHFDAGAGDVIADSSGAPGGPSNGFRSFGGTPAGPVWATETPFP